MSLVRVLAERLLQIGLLLARIAFVALGVSALTATIGLGGFISSGESSMVARRAMQWIQATAGVFFASGVLLFIVRTWVRIPRAPDPSTLPEPPFWLAIIPLTLLGQAVGAFLLSSDLAGLWAEVVPALERTGVFREMQRGGPNSGLVLVPVAVVLSVPALEALAGLFLGVVPLLLVALHAARARFFPKALVMTAITQLALVAGAWCMVQVFALAAAKLIALESSEGGAELRSILSGVRRMQAVLGPTASAYALLLPASVVWMPAMIFSRRLASVFVNGRVDVDRRG